MNTTSTPGIGLVYEPKACASLFPERSLFLSASIPYQRKSERLKTAAEREENEWFVAHAEPLRIRQSLAHLCRFAFRRGLGIVFGGHPAISPLLLEAAARFSPDPTPRTRIVIFQSLFYLDRIPKVTLELANWENGLLFWTPAGPDEETSLTRMRTAMASAPGLVGAIFIGGMEGLREEARLFDRYHRQAPMYALGSTGSAAAQLFSDGAEGLSPNRFHGNLENPDILRSLDAYSVVFQDIFADPSLGVEG